MCKVYKIYCDFCGWIDIGYAATPMDVYNKIMNIYEPELRFLIIEHDYELKSDIAYKRIYDEVSLLRFKEEVFEDKKKKKR